MSSDELVQSITIEAGADLSTKQYLFVDVASDGQVDPVGTDGADAIGVLLNKPAAAGRAATVQIGGVAKVLAGGTITAGQLVKSLNSGKADVAASGKRVLGKALTGGADGEIISVLLGSRHLLA